MTNNGSIQPQCEQNVFFKAASDYRRKGFSVIPLKPKSKIPCCEWKEYQNRLPTEEEIKEWWANWPNANIGIVTGKISDLTVIDFDNEEAFELAKKNDLPHTPLSRTGKGRHAYFKYADGVRNFQKRDDLPNIDLRGDGGYVVAPPSIHESGKTYVWENGLDYIPLAELPEWILAKHPKYKKPLRDLYKGAEVGNRNQSLTRIVGSLVSDDLSFEECRDLALAWNQKNKSPLDMKEVERTVKSIFDKHYSEKVSEPLSTKDAVEPVEALIPTLFPVKEFPLRVLPPELQKLILKAAKAYHIDIAPVACTMLAILSAAIGNSLRISVREGWEEPVFLWVMIIGRSGSGKSPLIKRLLIPIQEKQSDAFSVYKDQMSEYKLKIQKYQANIKRLSKKEPSILEPEPEKPRLMHYFTHDITVEALADAMDSSHRGILIAYDELSGFIRSHDQYKGNGTDRQKYLELWSCSPWKIDRVTKETKYIKDTGCSILGGIQSLVLPKIFGEESLDDGLLPRFLMTTIDRSFKKFSFEGMSNIDMAVWRGIVNKCYDIPLGIDKEGYNLPEVVTFSEEAAKIFSEFFNDYTLKSKYLPARAEVFIPKLISYVVRLSGVLQVIRGSVEDFMVGGCHIEETTIKDSIAIINYFSGQAMKTLRLYHKDIKISEIETELIRTIHSLQNNVRNGRLSIEEITQTLNGKLPVYVRQTNQAIGYALRKIGLKTVLSVGHSYLMWEPERINKIFFLYIEASTASTSST